jgi:tRNA threonylcarbamoyladenosine biosynthesis protein TsaE
MYGADMEDIPSPSYTLVQVYDAIIPNIWHIDLYRITELTEIIELGFEDMYSNIVSLIEWPERLQDKIPERYISVNFELSKSSIDERTVSIKYYGNNWKHRLEKNW